MSKAKKKFKEENVLLSKKIVKSGSELPIRMALSLGSARPPPLRMASGSGGAFDDTQSLGPRLLGLMALLAALPSWVFGVTSLPIASLLV